MKNFLLIIVAVVLMLILAPFGFIYAMFVAPSKSDYFRGIAESIDQMGNHVMQYLFNQWMVRHNIEIDGYVQEPYLFGNIDETVSSALGKNKRNGTLTKSGRFLDAVLNRLDKNHSLDAIEETP